MSMYGKGRWHRERRRSRRSSVPVLEVQDLREIIFNRAKEMNLTLADLADRAGVNREGLSKWRRGKKKTTDSDQIARLLAAVGIHL